MPSESPSSPPTARPLRAAVVGLGVMGRLHSRILATLPQVTLVGLADHKAATLDQLTRDHGVPGFTNHRSLLESTRPDLVVVAVPTRHHGEIAGDSLRAGAHVLIEKPMTATDAEAQRLMAIAADHGRRIGVGHSERFNPVVIALKRHWPQIGRVFQLTIRRLGPFPARVSDIGVVLDLGPHDLDLMEYLVGAPLAAFQVEAARHLHDRHQDIAAMLMRFEDGTIGVLQEAWLSTARIRDITVHGAAGTLIADLLAQTLTLYPNPAADGLAQGSPVDCPVPKGEPLRLELQAFVRAILDGTPFLVEAAAGARAVALCNRLAAAGLRRDPDGGFPPLSAAAHRQ